MSVVKITLSDNFNWNLYEKEVFEKIIMSKNCIKVIWDLSGFTRIPYEYIGKQVLFIYNIKNVLWKNIKCTEVIVSDIECYNLLKSLFNCFKTKKPIKILLKSKCLHTKI